MSEIARTMPGTRGQRKHPSRSLEDVEDVALERLAIPRPLHSCAQFLSDNGTQILERSKPSMELLQGVVGSLVAKRVDEELRVQHVLARRAGHGSESGDPISTPSMARVPSMSSR
jgi:hypothetical protein